MKETNLLLNAYYEALYHRLETNRKLLATRIEKLLADEIAKHSFGNFDKEKFTAYLDACLAFVDERIEAYNPIGIQYTFDRPTAQQALELELQLNWYDSRAEFEALMQAVRSKAQTPIADETISQLADQLIIQVGAFPDNTIISAFEAEPALPKLPDYILARAIEEIIREIAS